MTRIRQVKSNFTAGEISEELLGRSDLSSYANGARTLKNVFIYPTGGVTRRAGMRYIDTVSGTGRLLPFEFNREQTYLIVVTGNQLDVYLDDVKIETLISPWPETEINQLSWTQSADTLLITHPDYTPKRLLRDEGGNFVLEDWVFYAEDNVIRQPFYKYADSAVTITPSGTTGTITLTSSSDVFSPGHAGTRLQVGGQQVEVLSYDSPTVVTVNVVEDLLDTNETIDWYEQAFSSVRGYPTTVAFHQDRLVIGGSRDLPNRLWFSRSGDLFNFNVGTGLDDESIEFAILSDQVNAIRGIFSGRHLQVFTSGAEWIVTGEPLTPQTVQLNRQTRVGSVIDRSIPPVTVDGATVFAARNTQELREFLYTDLEQAYTAVDLAITSRHIANDIIDHDYDPERRIIFTVREGGSFATMTFYRSEKVRAWTSHETQGLILSVSVVGQDAYVLVERQGSIFIEKFEDDLNLDSALTGESATPTNFWSGLGHLEAQEVCVIADGVALDSKVTVTSGAILLDDNVSNIEVGLPYTHIVEPLPPGITDGTAGRKLRLVEGIFRLYETQALRLDIGRGLKDINLTQFNEDDILDAPPPKVSEDIRVRALGWQSNGTQSLWRIEQDIPYPFTLLSTVNEIKVND